jgi:glycerate kinase
MSSGATRIARTSVAGVPAAMAGSSRSPDGLQTAPTRLYQHRPMRVLVAFDKFKGSIGAPEACAVAARVIAGLGPAWRADCCPLTDGGDGFTGILTKAAGGREAALSVSGPRGAPVKATIGIVAVDGIPRGARARFQAAGPGASLAVVEMAAASGLALLEPAQRDPLRASSRGTGELIWAAAQAGVQSVLLGVGGSATHDLGLGALGALGIGFADGSGRPIDGIVPADFARLERIGGRLVGPIPPVLIACDVDNPLLGPRGAAALYGPQKGLRPADAAELERQSVRVAELLCRHFGRPGDLAAQPGAGAAGGTAFGLMAAAGATLVPGFELVAAWLDIEGRLAGADLLVTGEGRFDDTSLSGKGPGAVARMALSLGMTVHVFAGQVALSRAIPGLVVHEITPSGMPMDEALAGAPRLLESALRRALSGA